MSLLLFMGVFLAGGVGAWLRFTVDSFIKTRIVSSIPLGTFLINLIGSFVLGMLTGAGTLLVENLGSSTAHTFTLLLGTGLLGGFTTFSTAMVEVVTAVSGRRPVVGLFLWLGQAIVCIGAAALGLVIF